MHRHSYRPTTPPAGEPAPELRRKPEELAKANADLKRAEAAVRESEARFRSVLQNSADCIYRLNVQTGRYEFVSPAAEKIVGFSPEYFLKMHAAEALTMIHPDDLPAVRAALQRLDETGEIEAEYRQRTIRGEYRWVSNRIKLTRDEAGRPLYRDGAIRDITHRKLQEQRVHQLSRLYAVLSRVNETIVRTHEPADLYREVCRILADDGERPLVWIGIVHGTSLKPVAAAGRASDYVTEIRVETEGELGAGPTGTCIREGRTVVNDDFDVNPATRPWREAARKHHVRSSASFPLRQQGVVVGALSLYASEPGTFDPEQVGLLEALSANVSYALDKMGQETALSQSEESLRVQSSMALDLLKEPDPAAVCRLLADRLFSVADGAIVGVSEFDPDRRKVIVRSVRSTPEDRAVITGLLGVCPEGLVLDLPEQIPEQWKDGELAQAPCLDVLFFGQMPSAVCDRLTAELGLGDIFGMPCSYEDDILGTVVVVTHARGPLRHRALIEALVIQAGLALKRIRAHGMRLETERRNQRLLTGIARIFREALTCKTEEELGRVCLEVAEEVTESKLGFIAELDAKTGRLDDIAIRAPGWEACRMADQSGHGEHMPIGLRVNGLHGEVLRTSKSLLTNTPAAHPASVAAPEGHPPLSAFLGIPLMRDGRTIGVFGLGNREGGYGQVQKEAAEMLAPAIVLAFRSKRAEVGLREANERLEQEDRGKNEFLAVLSHELRNPLAPIRNSLYILDRATPGSDQARRAKTVIDRQSAHLSRLVDDLLDMTRIKRNKIRLQKERLELNEAVERAVDDNRSLFDHSGVRLELVQAPGPVHVSADRTRIAQVVGNLLQNAAKFCRRGGRTLVSVLVESGQATVRVADDGVGVSPEVLGRLFQPFMQAEQSLDRSQGGLGLGLALVKGLVELHGGAVEVKSPGVGLGTEVTLRLPLEVDLLHSKPASVADAGAARQRVLIVEDNADSADSLRELLELEGHDVVVAYDGPSGVDLARRHHPGVVLCDIGLPGMDGYAVARALRAEPALEGTRLVALSGYALPEDLERARVAGFDLHLAKPATLEKLHDAVRSGRQSGSAR